MWQRRLLLIALTVLLMNFCIVAAAQSDDVEWLDAEEYTLYWGDEINHSGYLIKASDFSPAKAFDTENDYVVLTIGSIYDDSWMAILANNTEFSNNTAFDDRLNVTALEIITGNDISSPYATISVKVANSTEPLTPTRISWINATFEFESFHSDEIYIDERAYFTLEMKNKGDDSFGRVTVTKELPVEFVLDPDADPVWNVSFDPYEKKILEFSIKALKPGSYDLAGTSITVEHEGRTYSRELNNSTLDVHGPFITASKSLSSTAVDVNGNVDVILDIVNEGDRAAHVTVSDQLPLGAVLLDGDTGMSRVLKAEDNISLSYSMRMDKIGDVTVPPAQIRFVDSKEYEGTVYSEKMLMKVRDPAEVIESSYEEEYPADAYGDGYSEDVSTNAEETGVTEETEDHGKLQFLYDILDSITGFLKDTKDKIL
ncbi:hypothetical protein [Methanolobus sp. WCC4]|uniref:COG1470 family protein n=1 Tax=Methanolobus sp. WCC4 TaxID=3125784 RepID=UPI0030F979A9